MGYIELNAPAQRKLQINLKLPNLTYAPLALSMSHLGTLKNEIGSFLKLFGPKNVKHVEADQDKMIRVRAGDQTAFKELYDSHKGATMSFVFQMLRNSSLAEEVTQEVFLRVYRDRESYEPTAAFRTYLFTIARNLCLDHLRSPKSREENLEDYQLESLASNDHGEQELFEKADREQVEECLEKLKPEQKECLLHRTVSELSYEQIAEVTKLSLSAVKSHIFRAKKALEECVRKSSTV